MGSAKRPPDRSRQPAPALLAAVDTLTWRVATQPLGRGPEVQTPSSLESFRAYGDPGYIQIATNFLAADGCLITETRVLGTDAR